MTAALVIKNHIADMRLAALAPACERSSSANKAGMGSEDSPDSEADGGEPVNLQDFNAVRHALDDGVVRVRC